MRASRSRHLQFLRRRGLALTADAGRSALCPNYERSLRLARCWYWQGARLTRPSARQIEPWQCRSYRTVPRPPPRVCGRSSGPGFQALSSRACKRGPTKMEPWNMRWSISKPARSTPRASSQDSRRDTGDYAHAPANAGSVCCVVLDLIGPAWLRSAFALSYARRACRSVHVWRASCLRNPRRLRAIETRAPQAAAPGSLRMHQPVETLRAKEVGEEHV